MSQLSSRPFVRGLAVAAVSALTFGGLSATAHASTPVPADLGSLSTYRQLPASSKATIIPNQWMVQVQGQPSKKGGNDAANKATQQRVLKAAKDAGIEAELRTQHTQLWNGMSLKVSDSSVAALRAIPGVVAVFPATSHPAPEPIKSGQATPTIANAIQMTGAAAANSSGYTGKGIKVGIIDSGIDLDHADLGGDGVPGNPQFPNARVKYGYDFVGDNYDSSGRYGSPTPAPDAIPDDCGGHGSHVAGIIGADGDGRANSVTGIAPDVTLGAYRVFGCEGSVDTDVIISAIERATADGMDIINMSLGWGFYTWPDAPEAQAADAAVDAGVIVVDAMGNDGEYGTFTGGAPAVGEKSIAVASIENTTVTANAFKLGEKLLGYQPGDSAPVPTTGSLQVVSAGPDAKVVDGTEPVSGCDAAGPLAVDPTGKALLMKRGSCTFYEKAMNAQQAGAAMAIIYNRDDTLMTPALTGPEGPITIPVVVVKYSDGLALQEAAAAGTATIQFGPWTAENPNPEAGLASSFTSVGLAADLSLKPDVAAPGGNIWSTYPLEKGGYTNMSGTSMASPHVAGSIALLLEARPEYKGKALAVRDLLQNYSSQTLWHLAPSYGLPDMVQVQGSGLIDINDSINATTFASPGKLSLGEGYDAKTNTITLRNTSTVAKTYTTSVVDAVGAAAPTDDPSFDYLPSTVGMPATVTVPAGGSVAVPVSIAPAADAPNGYLYGGWIHFTAGDEVLSVPFGGMAGDYQAETVLTWATLGQAGADPANPGEIAPIPPAEGVIPTVTAKKNAISLLFHLQYPASNVKVDVYQANADGTKGALVGTALETGKMGRDDGQLVYTWDGTYLAKPGKKQEFKKAGPGSYILQLRVLKPLADANDPAMWETWDSPAFRLKSMN